MTLLAYEAELKKPAAFEDEVKETRATTEERKLAQSLIEAATEEDFDLSKYKDEYTNKLAKLVEGKAKHSKKVVGAKEEEPAVINLMDALRKSLDRAKKSQTAGSSHRAAQRTGKKAVGHGKRKTG